MSILRFLNWLDYHCGERCPEVSQARWNGMLKWYAARERDHDFPACSCGLLR